MECEGRDVAEALADCVAREPRLKSRIFREDGTVWVGVFVNGRNVRQAGGTGDAPRGWGRDPASAAYRRRIALLQFRLTGHR